MKLIMEHWRKYLAEATAADFTDAASGQRFAVPPGGNVLGKIDVTGLVGSWAKGVAGIGSVHRDEDDIEAEEEDHEAAEEEASDENETAVDPDEPDAPVPVTLPREPVE